MDLERKVTPKTLVLDLLRVSPDSAPVRGLVQVGELFGFSSNAVRVATTRLVTAGLLESDERGWYRLAPGAGTVNEWVEWWRHGDRRRRAWNGSWIMALLSKPTTRAARRASVRALTMFGFAEGLPNGWVRPDNLAGEGSGSSGGAQALRIRLREVGLELGANVFCARDLDDDLVEGWRTRLWPLADLQRGYRRALRDLDRSREHIAGIPPERAMVETFLLGGAAIRILARDPLLPEEIMPGDERRALTATMRDYDKLGRRIWRRGIDIDDLSRGPSHLAVLQGGRA